jgi:hypothetical protein
VDRSIGLDAHASSCTLAVVSGSGKRSARRWWRRTRGPDRCRATDPEATLHLPGGGDALGVAVRDARAACRGGAVAAVRESRGPKDARRDAFGLADQLRVGGLHREAASGRLLALLRRSCAAWAPALQPVEACCPSLGFAPSLPHETWRPLPEVEGSRHQSS